MSTSSPALDRLLEANRAAGPARGRTVHVSLGADALADMPGWLADHAPDSDDLIVCDDHTWAAAGAQVARLLGAAGRRVRARVLAPRPGDDHLVCEDGVIAALRDELAAHPRQRAVAVGAGTVNDIAKMASFELGRDYVVAPTAASMNGYTSLIAAVLVDGVKRTLPAQQPVAIFSDARVLREAPPRLNRAGFGDLLSKPYSNADWVLSHLVRDVPYDPTPSALLDDVFQRMVAAAPEVGRAEDEGLHVLMEAILLSGFSMTTAGTSAPASGGEHLISHYWDMEQLHRGRPLMGLHGTQVGVGTRISALLYERLVALSADDLAVEAAAARRADAAWLDDLGAVHDTLSTEIVAEIRDQLAAKQKHGAALRAELEDVRARWPGIRARLEATLMPAACLTRALRQAGCVDRASGIDVGFARLVKTIRVCRHIRSRYVALDLIDDLGLLEGWSEQVAHLTEAPA